MVRDTTKEHVRVIKRKKMRRELEQSLTPYMKLTPNIKYLKVRRDSMKVLRKT